MSYFDTAKRKFYGPVFVLATPCSGAPPPFHTTIDWLGYVFGFEAVWSPGFEPALHSWNLVSLSLDQNINHVVVVVVVLQDRCAYAGKTFDIGEEGRIRPVNQM